MSQKLPEIGSVIASRYRLTAKLGEGGYGVVWKAHQESMGRDVAIKMLRPEAAQNPEEVERFRREVFNASCLKHPNTITLYDYGQTDDGELYIAMEYLSGMNLGQWLRKNGPADHERALDIIEQILKSLREAHANGILHRDLKPENIYLNKVSEDERVVKVLDFGLSKAIGGRRRAGQRTLTKEGRVYGTPHYMSPEQACAMKLSAASDIYSVGLLAWEILTGRTAFTGPTPVDILLKQVNDPVPELPSPLRGSVLDEFIKRATVKDQQRRLASAREAVEWLGQRVERERLAEIERAAQPVHTPTRDNIPVPQNHPTKPHITGAEPWFALKPPELIDAAEIELRLEQLPMGGRQEELHDMLRWGQQALVTGGVLWITGERGIGKTRLLEEWLKHMEMHPVTVLRGRYQSEKTPLEGIAHAIAPMLGDVTRSGVHIPPGTLTAEAMAELREIIDSGDSLSSEEVHSARLDAAISVIERSFYALAKRRQTILVLEDLQWSDPFTIRLVEHWKQQMATRAIGLVLVFTCRDERTHSMLVRRTASKFGHIQSRSGRAFTYSYDLHLERLSDETCGALLDDLLPFEPSLQARIIQAGRGNPMFLTEIVRFLLDGQMIAWDPATRAWTIIEQGSKGAPPRILPPHLEAQVTNRVKHYLAAHRLRAVLETLLLRALLIGDRFDLRLLKELLAQEGRRDLEAYLDDSLEAFSEAEVLLPTVIDGRAGLEFGYELMRQNLLSAKLWSDEEERHLHVQIANAKQRYYKRRGELYQDLHAREIADHWECAGDHERAFTWSMRAARGAEQSQEFRRALDDLRNASSLLTPALDPNGEHRLEIRLSEGRIYRYLGDFGPAEAALRDAIEETRRVGDTVGEALTSESLAAVLVLMTRYEEALAHYAKIEALYEQFGDRLGLLRCRLGRADVARFCGDYRTAHEQFADILRQAEELDDTQLQARCLFGLARGEFAGGRFESAKNLLYSARKRSEALGDTVLCSEADIDLGIIAIFDDYIENATSMCKHSLEIKQRLGDLFGQANAHLALGMALRRTHRIDEASEHANKAKSLYEELDHTYGVAHALCLRSEICWVRGELQRAVEHGGAALELSEQIDDKHGQTFILLHLALCNIDSQLYEIADGLLNRATELIDALGLDMLRPKTMTLRGMILESKNQLEDAVICHDDAQQTAERQGQREIVAFSAVNLAKARLMMGDLHAARIEAPLALDRAESTGHAHALLFALTLRAIVARLENQTDVLDSTLRRLRVLHDNATQVNMRIPQRLLLLANALRAKLSSERAFPLVLSIVEVIRALGDAVTADALAKDLMKRPS